MAPVIAAVLILLAAYYAGVMGLFAAGWQRVLRRPARGGPLDPLPFVSVIVPARNEQVSIRHCVEAILANSYPPSRFELIVVDDASTDATPALLRKLKKRQLEAVPAGVNDPDTEVALAGLQIIRIEPGDGGRGSRKRRALEAGIAAAAGDVILTTDADCVTPPNWIRSMVSAFAPETGFVAGPVLYPSGGNAWFQAQALEFLGLVAVGAGAIGLGRPILCNGANAAFRREAFERLGGFDGAAEGAAGDDELLMWKVAESGTWDVRFCSDPAGAVITAPAPDLASFFRQRLRWASLASQYPSAGVVLSLVLIFLFYVLLLGSLLALPLVPQLAPAVIVALILKAGSEAFVLAPACRHFGRLRLMVWLLPAQIFQMAYIVTCAAAGTLKRLAWTQPGRTP